MSKDISVSDVIREREETAPPSRGHTCVKAGGMRHGAPGTYASSPVVCAGGSGQEGGYTVVYQSIPN